MLMIAILVDVYCAAYLCVCIKNKAARINSIITLALGVGAAVLALNG